MIFLLLLVIVMSTSFVVYRIKNKRLYELAEKTPSVKDSLPLIGVGHKFLGATREDIYKTLKDFSYQSIENGGLVKFWVGPTLHYMITDTEDAEVILKSQLAKTTAYALLGSFIGKSTLNAPVPVWKYHRKILMPAFTSKMMESYFPTFVAKSRTLVEKLDEQVNKGEFQLFPYMSAYELAIVCETTFGVNVNCQEDPNHPFLVQVEIMMEITSERIFNILQHPEWMFKLSPQYAKFCKARQTVNEFILKIVETKREEIKAKRRTNPEGKEIDVTESKIPSFLELVLNMEKDIKYTDTELMQELIALTLAGTDTSAISLSFFFELMSKYPDVQEKVYQELHDVFSDSTRSLAKEDIPKLQYLDRVLKESLRLYGPSALIARTVEQETKLPSGHTLPAGCDADISIYGIHRDPRHWGPDAETFDPDRFLPGKYDNIQPCSYLPFSNGPRNCPGYHFGTTTLKIAISDVLRKFKIVAEPLKSRVPNLEAKFDILTKPLHGVCIALERRK
ncbi:unnamed protein product [Chilo suppressalis]|uniref:Cytochrome P450 n=3 Tax=Chilo suppressalis TaxID=168631 RepID=A0ABN8BIS0_CHISP|nr:unnamed protein product [Chilo suppressalis]